VSYPNAAPLCMYIYIYIYCIPTYIDITLYVVNGIIVKISCSAGNDKNHQLAARRRSCEVIERARAKRAFVSVLNRCRARTAISSQSRPKVFQYITCLGRT